MSTIKRASTNDVYSKYFESMGIQSTGTIESSSMHFETLRMLEASDQIEEAHSGYYCVFLADECLWQMNVWKLNGKRAGKNCCEYIKRRKPSCVMITQQQHTKARVHSQQMCWSMKTIKSELNLFDWGKSRTLLAIFHHFYHLIHANWIEQFENYPRSFEMETISMLRSV